MDRTGRCAVKVPPDVHANIKLLAAALDIRQSEVVQRAIALYRERHAGAVAELTERRALRNLSELSIPERIEAQRDRIRAILGDAEIWVGRRTAAGDAVIVVDPYPEDDDTWDLMEAVGELIGVPTIMFGAEDGRRMGIGPGQSGSWRVQP